MKFCFFILFLFFSSWAVFSQDSKEKLLVEQLEKAGADSTKIRLLKELSILTLKSNFDVAKQYSNDLLILSLKAGDKNGQANAYNFLGNVHFNKTEYVEALELYLKSLRLFSDLGDKKMLAVVYTNIGSLNTKQGNYKEARLNLEMAVNLKEKLELTKSLANSYLSLASLTFMEKDLDQALVYFEKGRGIAHSFKDIKVEAACLNGMAAVLFKKENYEGAVKGYSEAIELFKSFDGDNRKMISGLLHNLASAHRKLGQFDKAFELLNQSLDLAKEINSKEDIKQAYSGFKDYYRDKGEYDKALIAEENYSVYKDSVVNESTLKAVNEMQEKYKTEERKKEIVNLIKSNDQLKEKSTLQYSLLIVSVVALILCLLFVYFYFKQLKTKQLRKQVQLEQKALRSQMNPHFIFNSLNSIQRMYVEGNEDLANDYMADFSRLLRNILENSGKELIRLNEELDVIRLYMELELVRTDNSFEFICDIAEDIDTFQIKIPPLIFQPYLENAIWHGIIAKKEKGKIQLNIQKMEAGKLLCQVIDNGVGFYSSKKTKSIHANKSKGMEITAERLGGDGHVTIEELETGGTCITLIINYTV